MTHRLQHFLLCPTPALVQNMKLESSVAPTAWFWARGVVHLVETCMNDTKIIETMKTYCAQGEFLCPFYHHLQHLSFLLSLWTPFCSFHPLALYYIPLSYINFFKTDLKQPLLNISQRSTTFCLLVCMFGAKCCHKTVDILHTFFPKGHFCTGKQGMWKQRGYSDK